MVHSLGTSLFANRPAWIFLEATGLLFVSFLCLLIHEAVFFVLCVAGFVVWMKPNVGRKWESAAAVSVAPLFGALLWGIAYELTKPEVPIYSVTHVRLSAALSSVLYQYRSLDVLSVWTNDLVRSNAISSVQSFNAILTLLALCAVPLLIAAIIWTSQSENEDQTGQHKVTIKPIAFFIWMIVVCEAAGFIYVLAGGYSLDSRKHYIMMPLVIMGVASAISLIWRPQKRMLGRWGSSAAISAICIFGCLTSLLMISLLRMDLKRIDLLADLIMQESISDNLQAEGRPVLFDAQPALNRALAARGYKPVVLTPQSAKSVIWNMQEQRWHCCTIAETFGAALGETGGATRARHE